MTDTTPFPVSDARPGKLYRKLITKLPIVYTDFLDPQGNWICRECGACCMDVRNDPTLMPFDRGDGVCKHLDENMYCSIYEDRPPACRMENARALMPNLTDEDVAAGCAHLADKYKCKLRSL